MIKKSKIGSRIKIDENLQKESFRGLINNSDGLNVCVVKTGLIVTDSFIDISEIYQYMIDFGAKIRYVNMPWGINILDKLASQNADLSIFNYNASLNYRSGINSKLYVSTPIGYSMGGRHFSIITKKNRGLKTLSLEKQFHEIKRSNVYIAPKSDRMICLAQYFGISEEVLNKELNIIPFSDANYQEVFEFDELAVIIAGQNMRIAAQLDSRLEDIFNFDYLTEESRVKMAENSANCLVVSSRLCEFLRKDVEEIKSDLYYRFINNSSNNSLFDERVHELSSLMEPFVYDEGSESQKEKMVRRILHETYRIGYPVL